MTTYDIVCNIGIIVRHCSDAQTGLLGWVAFGLELLHLGASPPRDYHKMLLVWGRAGPPHQADDYTLPSTSAAIPSSQRQQPRA